MLIVDSIAAFAGGLAGISSNTTYIESAAGVAEGAKRLGKGHHGMAIVMIGLLLRISDITRRPERIAPSGDTTGHEVVR